MASAHAKITQMYVARSRAGCESTAADPIIGERPTRSLYRQCLGSNRQSVTRYTAPLGLTPREHALGLHAALRFRARRTDDGGRSPSCAIGNFELEQGRMQRWETTACGKLGAAAAQKTGMKESAIEPGVLTSLAGTPAAHRIS